jgi:predicted mannosyl-3-phosphoglycerate phosphatase (HAD superfamily)
METQVAIGVAEPLRPVPSLVVITAVDESVCTATGDASEDIREAVAVLSSRQIPVILSSHLAAADVRALQASLGVTEPFICDGGGALHLPTGYFGALPGFGQRHDGWDIISCASPRRDADESPEALRLLLSLYRMCAGEVIVVGVASHWRDRVLLREADVPIVVRCDADQQRLARRFPAAYVTEQYGAAGWVEAMLGSAER